MNWIQRDVLVKFLFTNTATLNGLRPEIVDSNLFSYHLNQLIGDGLITKTSRNNYLLTSLGKHTAGLISKDTGKLTRQPKIAVMIYAKNNKSEYLLFEWRRQPYLGQVSLPYGKLHFEDTPKNAAKTELAEKTGLSGALGFKKDLYYRVIDGQQTLTHMLIHIFEAEILHGKLNDGVIDRCFWSKLDNKLDYVPGFHELIKQIESASNSLEQVTANVE